MNNIIVDTKDEIWKSIPNYEGIYECSNFGRIKSLARLSFCGDVCRYLKEKILKPGKNDCGYFIVVLSNNYLKKTYSVHQLVAITFLNHKINTNNDVVVDHIDNNPQNNNLSNLQLLTNRLNLSKDKKGFTSSHIGVYWHKSTKKWASHIRIGGKLIHLGVFVNELEASEAYKKALSCDCSN